MKGPIKQTVVASWTIYLDYLFTLLPDCKLAKLPNI